jgi:hypothetical protein
MITTPQIPTMASISTTTPILGTGTIIGSSVTSGMMSSSSINMNSGATSSSGISSGLTASSGVSSGATISSGINSGTSTSMGISSGTTVIMGRHHTPATSAGISSGTTVLMGRHHTAATSTEINSGMTTGIGLGTSSGADSSGLKQSNIKRDIQQTQAQSNYGNIPGLPITFGVFLPQSCCTTSVPSTVNSLDTCKFPLSRAKKSEVFFSIL